MAELPDLTIASREAPACIHHWVLGEPVAGVVPGHCKRCGTDRGFPAHPEGIDRFDDYRELTESSRSVPAQREQELA